MLPDTSRRIITGSVSSSGSVGFSPLPPPPPPPPLPGPGSGSGISGISGSVPGSGSGSGLCPGTSISGKLWLFHIIVPWPPPIYSPPLAAVAFGIR
ncbi:hypothetical protein DWV37_07510 [Tannerella sp. AF04-6]|nr:hypothetical protein DWV37_07510 [Tannerella sp. AF04-6]